MKISFLGTGAANLEKNRDYTSSAIEVGDSVYLIDAGASAFSKMLDYGINPSKLRAVFITHGHFDHVGGLPMLVNIFSWTRTYGNIPISYYAPDRRIIDTVVDFIGELGESEAVRGNFNTYGRGLIYEDENIKAFAIPTGHIVKDDGSSLSYAIAVYAEGKITVFSGDLSAEFDSEAVFDFLKREKTDAFICELAHFSPHRLLEKIKDFPLKQLYFNHIAENEKNSSLLNGIKRGEYKFTVSAARDGEFLEV